VNQGHPAECLESGLVYVGSTQFQYQAVWSQTFCGVSLVLSECGSKLKVRQSVEGAVEGAGSGSQKRGEKDSYYVDEDSPFCSSWTGEIRMAFRSYIYGESTDLPFKGPQNT
jgi:hypothetical protein